MTTTTSRSEYFKAYRERNRAKRAAWMREWRRQRDAARKTGQEPASEAPKIPAPAPAPDGPKCRTCGKVLRPYDYARGECFRHPVERVRAARSAVRLTEDKHIERNYRVKKVLG